MIHLRNFNQYLKSPQSITLCLEYSENPEALKKWIEETEIKIENVRFGPMPFDDDRCVSRCIVAVNLEGETFDFGMSIHDTDILQTQATFGNGELYKLHGARKKVYQGLLYSILCSVRSESTIPNNFRDFCDELGYDFDSRKALRLFERCDEHARMLRDDCGINEEIVEFLPS